MAKKIFGLEKFQQGDFMSWYVTTQSNYLVNVTLYDNNPKVYFDESKDKTDIKPPLAQGAGDVEGTFVSLGVEVPGSSDLIWDDNNSFDITASDGTVVGYGYNIFIEADNNNDFNDVAITIMAWKSKG